SSPRHLGDDRVRRSRSAVPSRSRARIGGPRRPLVRWTRQRPPRIAALAAGPRPGAARCSRAAAAEALARAHTAFVRAIAPEGLDRAAAAPGIRAGAVAFAAVRIEGLSGGWRVATAARARRQRRSLRERTSD